MMRIMGGGGVGPAKEMARRITRDGAARKATAGWSCAVKAAAVSATGDPERLETGRSGLDPRGSKKEGRMFCRRVCFFNNLFLSSEAVLIILRDSDDPLEESVPS